MVIPETFLTVLGKDISLFLCPTFIRPTFIRFAVCLLCKHLVLYVLDILSFFFSCWTASSLRTQPPLDT